MMTYSQETRDDQNMGWEQDDTSHATQDPYTEGT